MIIIKNKKRKQKQFPDNDSALGQLIVFYFHWHIFQNLLNLWGQIEVSPFLTQFSIYHLKTPQNQRKSVFSKIFPPLTLSQNLVPPLPPPPFCFPPLLKIWFLHFLRFPELIYNIQIAPRPRPPKKIIFFFNLYSAGLHKRTSNTVSTWRVVILKNRNNKVETNLYFKYANKHVQFVIIYPTPGNS